MVVSELKEGLGQLVRLSSVASCQLAVGRLECSFLASDLFYVNVDMSNHSKWFRFRFAQRVSPVRGSQFAVRSDKARDCCCSSSRCYCCFCCCVECDILTASVTHCCLIAAWNTRPTLPSVEFSFSLLAFCFLFFSLVFVINNWLKCCTAHMFVCWFVCSASCQPVAYVFNARKACCLSPASCFLLFA